MANVPPGDGGASGASRRRPETRAAGSAGVAPARARLARGSPDARCGRRREWSPHRPDDDRRRWPSLVSSARWSGAHRRACLSAPSMSILMKCTCSSSSASTVSSIVVTCINRLVVVEADLCESTAWKQWLGAGSRPVRERRVAAVRPSGHGLGPSAGDDSYRIGLQAGSASIAAASFCRSWTSWTSPAGM